MPRRLPTRPEVLSFLLCDHYERLPNRTAIMRTCLALPFASVPSPEIVIYAVFDLNLPSGVHELSLSVEDPDAVVLGRTKPAISESAFKGGLKGGSVPLRLRFQKVGWHAVRLQVADIVTERLLCIVTPETRHLFSRQQAAEPDDPK